MDWESDPELKKIREEFVDSLQSRAILLAELKLKLSWGEIDLETIRLIDSFLHKLAGVAESYHFNALSQISGAIEEFMNFNSIPDKNHLVHFLDFLQDALTLSIQTRINPISLLNDPRWSELTSVVESLRD